MTKERKRIPIRILSILLTVSMLIGAMPMAVFAATTDIWVPDGKLTVIAHSGTITEEDTGKVFTGEARVKEGTAVTITLDETVYPDKSFASWEGDDGTKVPQKTFRLLVERNTAFYPTFTDLTGNFGDWRIHLIGDTCEDGVIYVRQDTVTGLKEYKSERSWHEYGTSTRVNDKQHQRTCLRCGYTELTDHYWNSGEVTTEATHTAEGVMTYTCYECAAKKYEPIAKTEGHAYGEWEIVTEAKNGNAGLRRRTCACGDVQESYYIKAEWEQYFNDRYLMLDKTNSKSSGSTRDEWHFAYKTAEGYDAYISSFKRDSGDTTTYAFLFIDDPSVERKPVYICRSAGELYEGSQLYGYGWALFHYVADKDGFFNLMRHMSQEIFSVTTPGGGNMQLFYAMRQWEEICNCQMRETEDWWTDSYTRTEEAYNGFECWKYTYKSSYKYYYVIKDSNVCIYSYDEVSRDAYNISMLDLDYGTDTSGMTDEERTEWNSTHFKVENIGKSNVKNLTFSKEKPETVTGYRVEVLHTGENGGYGPAYSWSTRYEWCGSSVMDDRYLFSIARVGLGDLSTYDNSFTDYMFRLKPVESSQYVFDHWEIYDPETGEYVFYSNAETVDLNYITVAKDSEGNVISRTDQRINDILRVRGIYKEKTYHVKVNGGTFVYDGGEKVSEGDVPVSKTITLSYDTGAIPEGYGFDCFADQNGNKLYAGNFSNITLTGDMEYTAEYFAYGGGGASTYGVSANAENGTVLMEGKEFYYGNFTPGTQITLTTVGNEGYDTFLGWYMVYWGKGKDPEYILLSPETTLSYTIPKDYTELTAKWSDGTVADEKYHDIIAAENGYCFIRTGYERLAVSAVRIGASGEVLVIKDPTVTFKQFTAWCFSGTNEDNTPYEDTQKVSDYDCYFYVEETLPTVITVAGQVTICTENHSLDAGEIIIPSTYTEKGVKRYTCTVCGWYTDESLPMLDHFCVHACSVCGGCTLDSPDTSCNYPDCTCAEKTALPVTNVSPTDFSFDGEGTVSSNIVTVNHENNTENPYVSFVLQALTDCDVGTIYDISLTDETGSKYTLSDGETITVTLTIGSANAQAILDGRMYFVHLSNTGVVIYGRGHAPITVDVAAGTVTFTADSCSPFVLVRNTIDYYGRTALAALPNADALLYAYDQIVEGVSTSEAEISVYNGTDPITQDELETVFDAYRRDHTEHFWLENSYNILYNSSTVLSLVPSYLMSGAQLAAAKDAFDKAVSDMLSGISSSMSEYQREKLLHDRLAAKAEYNETAANAHNAYGALVEGKTVCEGYAEAYQYLLQLAGLQSFIATGTSNNPTTGAPENHAWNIVRVDGTYYHVDLTWDDQDETLFYAYFNKTDSRMTEDHALAATDYALPVCNAETADYFSVNGGKLPAFDLEAVASLLEAGSGKARVYVTGDTAAFISAFQSNFAALAQELGLTGSISGGYSKLGREVILTVAPAGVTLSGAVTSFGSDAGEVTIALYQSGEDTPIKQTVVIGNSTVYAIEGVASGTYTLKVSKANHGTREYTITVGTEGVTQDVKICLMGDVTGDGAVDLKDWGRMRSHINETNLLTDYALVCADVIKDGTVDLKDWGRMRSHINETNPLW